MRWWRGKGRGREKVRVGMEADIYPWQCVTGSAKSAMMNVLAGINPQCTPPPPSSSTVLPLPLPPSPRRPPRTPLRHLSRPLTTRSRTLSKRTSLSLFSLSFTISTLPSSSLSTSLSFLRYSRCIFALLQLSSHYCYFLQRFHDKAARAFFLATLIIFSP